MNDALKWKVPKIPFWVVNFLLIGFAFYFVFRAPQSVGPREIAGVCLGCVALGALLASFPYYLDYVAMAKVIEVNALGSVADRINGLEQFTQKIEAVTDQWTVVQESVHQNAEKTGVAAKQIAEKMGEEVREFAEFMKKMNDSEKSGLRLEVDKLRRSETEYLQMLVRMLDHIFALRGAAVRSGQQSVADQITQFQSACLGTVRRVGLVSFTGEAEEAFDAARHQVADGKKPFDGAVISETVGPGYTFQGKLLRPALVRVREPKPAPPTATTAPAPADKTFVLDEQDDLALKSE